MLARSLDYSPIGACPVPAMTREGPDLATVNDDQGPIAVMLDLLNPTLAGGRL
jgi:hypothetical protein